MRFNISGVLYINLHACSSQEVPYKLQTENRIETNQHFSADALNNTDSPNNLPTVLVLFQIALSHTIEFPFSPWFVSPFPRRRERTYRRATSFPGGGPG